MTIASTGTPILYLGFTLLVIVLLAVDFFVLKAQGAHRVRVKKAAAWSVVWIAISLVFGGWLWWYLDGRFGREVRHHEPLPRQRRLQMAPIQHGLIAENKLRRAVGFDRPPWCIARRQRSSGNLGVQASGDRRRASPVAAEAPQKLAVCRITGEVVSDEFSGLSGQRQTLCERDAIGIVTPRLVWGLSASSSGHGGPICRA